MTIRTSHILTKNINLIGMCGHAGSGKDTSCELLAEMFERCYGNAFAYPLKDAAAIAFGIPSENFYDTEEKEKTDPFWHVSPRKIAQFFGTEFFRDSIHKLLPAGEDGRDFWIRRLYKILEASEEQLGSNDPLYETGDTVIITDVRFQNEVDFIYDNGGYIIQLSREGANGSVGITSHASEAISSLKFNHERTFPCENNGTIYQLRKALEQISLNIPFLIPHSEEESGSFNIRNL